MEETKVFLNTWEFYNDGGIGFGWMTAQEALNFMAEMLENEKFTAKYGEEFFVADIGNYLGVDFGELDYCVAEEVCSTIARLEDLPDWEMAEVIAVMEYEDCDVETAIERRDCYTIYSDIDSYLEGMDELIDDMMRGCENIMSRYFNYQAYHRDLMYDAWEASNGVIICY